MSTTTAPVTISPITRVVTDTWTKLDGSPMEVGSDRATVTGEKGTTECTGCFGISPSGRYRVYVTWKHGAARLGSSTVVDADSGIEAAIFAATRSGGGYLSCQAGTLESN